MTKDHYVSQFHLREFCDPSSLHTPDPWLWLGRIADGSVKRRAPKNIGTVANLFAGPGGHADSLATIETFLANEVESPAAFALRAARSGDVTGGLAAPIMRYLAWAAARSLPMQRLEAQWSVRFAGRVAELAEAAPEGVMEASARQRPVRLLHAEHGQRTVPAGEDAEQLLESGWFPDPTESANFLEGVHLQAYYFQARWFPRLKWFTLRPPADSYFIIGDRPVGWGVPSDLEAPPACLRDSEAFLIAPLSRSLALVGRNNSDPWSVTPSSVNAILAAWSHEWIAGPTADCVATALSDRIKIKEA